MDIPQIARDDQTLAAVQTIAQLVAAYRDALRQQGFGERETWELLIEYQREIMRLIPRN